MDLLKQPDVLVFIACTVIGLLSTIIGCVIWFVRLEGRTNYIEKDLERAHARISDTKTDHDSVMKEVFTKLNELGVQLAELNGFLKKQKTP